VSFEHHVGLRPLLACGIPISSPQVNTPFCIFCAANVTPFKGSWEGDIRIWKLDSKLRSLTQAGTVSALGVINSLQLLSPPKEFFQNSAWIAEREDEAQTKANVESVNPRQVGVCPILLVAGVGQEHRLGRWLTVGKGVVNGAIVFALSPRTLSG
jgi:ribosomal RNA-processing protein 9